MISDVHQVESREFCEFPRGHGSRKKADKGGKTYCAFKVPSKRKLLSFPDVIHSACTVYTTAD